MSPENPQPRTSLRREADREQAALVAAAVHAARRSSRRVSFLIAFATFAALLLGTELRRDDMSRVAYDFCRESNFPHAYLRTAPHLRPRTAAGIRDARRKLPILACRRTVQLQRPVRLRPAQEARYLRVYSRGRLPVVDDRGRVVGSEPLPAPPR